MDPCAPPNFITVGELVPPEEPYVLTDPRPDPIDLPSYTVFPEFCEVKFVIKTDPENAQGAFSIDEN